MTNAEENKECIPSYEIAAKYWSGIPATVDGMLVGFGFISDIDIRGSDKFLKYLFKLNNGPEKGRALDCGAGIGRITKQLLTKHFKTVDLVEQDKTFIEEAKKFVGPIPEVGTFYNTGLQDFEPDHLYDVIWCQWVLGHLTDLDFVNFFKNCGKHLNPNGVIVVKENLTSTEDVEMDDKDSSVTRPYKLMLKLLSDADLQCFHEIKQKNFPKFLYRVDMFALRPKSTAESIVL